MPFKLNQDRRQHIPRQKHRVANSAAYDATLRQRGSLTVWFTDEAIGGWRAEPRTTPGGQPFYSPLAIQTALTLRAGHRQLVGRRSRWHAMRTARSWLRRSGHAGDLGPNLEGLGPSGSILGGGHLMAAEQEEVVDPVVA